MKFLDLPPETIAQIITETWSVSKIYTRVLPLVSKLFREIVRNQTPPLPGHYDCSEFALCGQLNILEFIYDLGCPPDPFVCSEAARRGHAEIVKWARYKGSAWCKYHSTDNTIENGNLSVLKVLHETGYNFDASEFKLAAKHGHLEILKWLHDTVCKACRYSECEYNGYVQYLQQLILQHCCPLKTHAYPAAIRSGNADVITWLCKHGCGTD